MPALQSALQTTLETDSAQCEDSFNFSVSARDASALGASQEQLNKTELLMRNYPHIKESKTKRLLLAGMYKPQDKRSQFGPYVGSLQRPFAHDSDEVVTYIAALGLDQKHLFTTPVGRAVENDPQGWPSTRWADNNKDQESAFKVALTWMMRFESRIQTICDLDAALLSEGIDFVLTGDLVGRSSTWRHLHDFSALKLTERLLRELLGSKPVTVFVGDKNQMEALWQLRRQGHIITMSAPYVDEIEDDFGQVIQRSDPLISLTYKQTNL